MRITVFVEVRTLTVLIGKELDWYETAAQSVDARKQRRIISAARRFRSENPYSCRSCRFDVVLVGITSRLSRSLTEQSEDANLNLQDCLNSPGLYIIHCPGAFMTNF
jgi:Holliday junction resolvase-like predicted endonuclease